jgi:hypothetical protein
MTPIDRANINRENATHSTGPKTPEGKQRSSLNALRHGLTGQTVLLPGEDPNVLQEFCASYHRQYKPSGPTETNMVQYIAETQWRLNRIGTMENNLIALGAKQCIGTLDPDNPEIDAALAQAKAYSDAMDKIAKLSLHQHRLTRVLHQSLAELAEIQKERKMAEHLAFHKASEMRCVSEALKKRWKPADDGFEFSSDDLAAWENHEARGNVAFRYSNTGKLTELPRVFKPSKPAGPTEPAAEPEKAA